MSPRTAYLPYMEAAMATIERRDAELRLTLEGLDSAPATISLRDLERLAQALQGGLEAVANVLSGRPGVSAGPLTASVAAATGLTLVGIEAGSTVLEFKLEEPAMTDSDSDEHRLFDPPPKDLGFRALKSFVGGLKDRVEGAARLPDAWDGAVAAKADDLATFVRERNVSLTIESEEPDLGQQQVTISPQSTHRLDAPSTTIRRRRTASGRLILVDLGSGRIDLEEPSGRRVKGRFSAELETVVTATVGRIITASGEEEFDQATGKSGPVKFETIEAAAEAIRLNDDFWANRTATEQAEAQGVTPIASIADLARPDMFTDDDVQSLLEILSEEGG